MITPTACPGPCNNAWRRAEQAVTETGTEHAITPARGEPTHCDSCVDHTRQRLNELPGLLAALLALAAFTQATNPDRGYSSPPDTHTTRVTPGGHATITKQEGAP